MTIKQFPHPLKRGLSARGRSTTGGGEDAGAAAVEMALVLPVLLLLVFGIIEFSFLFGQFNEVRHSAREGARYAAVSNPDLGAGSANWNVRKSVCDAINLPGVSSVTVAITLEDLNGDGNPTRLEYGTVTVVASRTSLSGVPIITGLLPSTLTNSARFRVEQDGNWTFFGASACP